jgi:hypothetical protein
LGDRKAGRGGFDSEAWIGFRWGDFRLLSDGHLSAIMTKVTVRK